MGKPQGLGGLVWNLALVSKILFVLPKHLANSQIDLPQIHALSPKSVLVVWER